MRNYNECPYGMIWDENLQDCTPDLKPAYRRNPFMAQSQAVAQTPEYEYPQPVSATGQVMQMPNRPSNPYTWATSDTQVTPLSKPITTPIDPNKKDPNANACRDANGMIIPCQPLENGMTSADDKGNTFITGTKNAAGEQVGGTGANVKTPGTQQTTYGKDNFWNAFYGAAKIGTTFLAEKARRNRQDQYTANNLANPYQGMLSYNDRLSKDSKYGSVQFQDGGVVPQEQIIDEQPMEDDESLIDLFDNTDDVVEPVKENKFGKLIEEGFPDPDKFKNQEDFYNAIQDWNQSKIPEPNAKEDALRSAGYVNGVYQGDDVEMDPISNLPMNRIPLTAGTIKTKSNKVNLAINEGLASTMNQLSGTFPGLVVSSANDQGHTKNSAHYDGDAIDIGAGSSNKVAYSNFLNNLPALAKQMGFKYLNEGDHIHVSNSKKGKLQSGGQINDNNGYLSTNLHNYTNKKVIDSNHITTEGMAFPIIANGQPLYPNTGDYLFPTDKVTETPMKKGGFTKMQYSKERGLKDANNQGDFDNITPNQARQILHDKKVNGHPLTPDQYKLFGYLSAGNTLKYQAGGSYHPLTNPNGIKPKLDMKQIFAKPEVDNPYEPSQFTNNIKGVLSAIDMGSAYINNPLAKTVNGVARGLNSLADGYTSARYFADGQYSDGVTDLGESLLDLVPLRTGKGGFDLGKNGKINIVGAKLNKFDKSINNIVRGAKVAAVGDDFIHSTPGKILFGDPDSKLQYQTGGYTPRLVDTRPANYIPAPGQFVNGQPVYHNPQQSQSNGAQASDAEWNAFLQTPKGQEWKRQQATDDYVYTQPQTPIIPSNIRNDFATRAGENDRFFDTNGHIAGRTMYPIRKTNDITKSGNGVYFDSDVYYQPMNGLGQDVGEGKVIANTDFNNRLGTKQAMPIADFNKYKYPVKPIETAKTYKRGGYINDAGRYVHEDGVTTSRPGLWSNVHMKNKKQEGGEIKNKKNPYK